MRKVWSCFVAVLLCPVKHPACAIAWWIAGMWIPGTGIEAVLYTNSASAVFMEGWGRHLQPLTSVVFLVLLPGVVGGPWCLLYQFLTGALFGGKGCRTKR